MGVELQTMEDFRKRIDDERGRISALDASLDASRTPYLKWQLQFAGHLLDDAENGLRHAAQGDSSYKPMWLGFAEMNIQQAGQRRQKVQESVDKFGGPDKITEYGG